MSVFKNIDEAAGEPTERKMPGAVPASENKEQTTTSSFYDPEKDKTTTEAKKESAATTTNAPAPGKLSKDKADQSGMANAYLHSGIQESVLKAAVLIRYVTRFNDSEKETILSLQDKPDADKTAEEKSLNARFLKYTETFQKQNDAIKTTEDEMKNLAYGYSMYAEITGKETNPAVIIASTIINGLINKIMDIYIS